MAISRKTDKEKDLIYYHVPQDHLNYIVGSPGPCTHCKKAITRIVLGVFNTLVQGGCIEHYCVHCRAEAAKKFRTYTRTQGSWFGRFICAHSMPTGALLFNPNAIKPGRNTNMDLATAAYKQIGDEVIHDHTRHAGRESWEGASVGLPYEEKEEAPMLEQRERLLLAHLEPKSEE